MKKLILNTTLIFLLSALFHFVYTLCPNPITALFFPVNESIWEHFKLLNTATFVFSILEFCKVKEKNFFTKAFLRMFFNLILLACLYLPIFSLFGESLPITLMILFISIFLSELLLYILPWEKSSSRWNLVFSLLILAFIMMFIYFTYHPLHSKIFLDLETKQYGLDQ